MSTAPGPNIVAQLHAAAAEGNLDERGIPKKLGRQYRKVQKAAYDKETRTVTMAVSSSTPVERYYGSEILSHEKGAVRTNRLDGGVSLLFNHDYDQLLGRSLSYEIGDPIRVTSRFGTSELAIEKERDVEAEILVDVSIGYIVHEWEITEDKNGVRTYLAVDWELLEVSLVTVPADPTVGVGRDIKDGVPVKVRSFRKASDDDYDDDSDEDDDDQDGDEGSNDNGSEPAPRTIQPEATRTAPMEPTTVVVDIAAENATRVAALRTLHTAYPTQFTERDLKNAEDLGIPAEKAKLRVWGALINEQERNKIATASDEVFGGMTQRDLETYSISGAYRAAANATRSGTFTGKDNEGGFEREVGQTLRKAAEARGVTGFGAGIPVPSITTLSLARAQRAIASTGGAGTATNFTVVTPDPIELLRNRTVLLAMGARMLTGLHGAVQMTKQTGAASSNWLAELSGATESDPTLGFFTMTPKRLSMANAYTRDFLAQSALAVDSFLANDRAMVLARSLDTAGLAGSGTAPVPKGLLNISGLAAVLAGTTRASNGTVTAGAGGVPMTYVDFNNLEAAIANVNGDIGTLGIITTPKVRAAARSTPKTPGTATDFIWPDTPAGENGLQTGPLGIRSITTANSVLTGFTANSVSGLHAVLMGVWDQFLIGDWGLSELIADPYTGAAAATMNFTEHAFYDINVRHIESFAACTSALPS